MSHRISGAVMWALMLCLIVLAVTGCSSAPSAAHRATTTPAPTSSRPPRADAAVAAAASFEQRRCSWTWRTPQVTYVAAQQQLATPAYARELAADSDPVSWRREVVAGQQSVTCTISAAQRLIGAPSSSASVYARMSVNEQIASTSGSFWGGTRIVSWRVELVGRRWLVAGTFDGG